MASIGLIVGVSITVLLLIAGITVGIVLLMKRLRVSGVPPNSPIILSFVPERSDGFAVGVETKLESSPHHNRVSVNMKPLDVPYDSDGNPIIKDDVVFPMEKSKRLVLSKGTLSEHREVVICLPERATDLPEKFRNETILGRALMLSTEFISVRDDAIRAVKAGDQQRVRIIRDLNTGELSEDLYSGIKEFYKDFVNKAVDKEVKPKKDEPKLLSNQ